MSISQLNNDLLKILLKGKASQKSVIKNLDELIRHYDVKTVERWYNKSNNQNSLLHELVEKDMPEVIAHLVVNHQLNINIRRKSDGLTPYQLAEELDNRDMCEILKTLGALDKTEDVRKWRSEEDKDKAMRIVWVDLEMTSIEDPKILECAVVITDKDLKELTRDNWVIHFEKSVLEGLEDWHQKTFADKSNGGNGLFADVLESKLTREEVEEKLLALLVQYCPEKECPLAGSSIHIDKSVLKAEMPKVHDYLHYRIIDVTSFQLVTRRWAPWLEAKMKQRLAEEGQETVNHRAMDDVLWSISFMKQIRSTLFKQNNKSGDVRNQRNEPARLKHDRRRSVSPSIIARSYPPTRSNQPGNENQLYNDERQLIERLELDRSFPVKSLKLNKKDQQIYDENPHLREVFMNKQPIDIYKKFTVQNRILKLEPSGFRFDNTESKKYSTTEYWGQRKLLLTEIEFLVNSIKPNGRHVVVYASARSALHIPLLCSFFPDLDFVLYDASEFLVKTSSNMEIKAEKFTDRAAESYSNSKHSVLFICNVRTYNPGSNAEVDMMTDMTNQASWVRKMKPSSSLLNFRLPRTSGKNPYFKGHLLIEPWSSRRPTECRLFVDKEIQMMDYDNTDFAGALSHFQNTKRTRFYEHNMDTVDNEGLDHCYDCQTEIFILGEYLIKIQGLKNDANLLQPIAAMSSDISRKIEDKQRQSLINVKRRLNVIPKGPKVNSSNV